MKPLLLLREDGGLPRLAEVHKLEEEGSNAADAENNRGNEHEPEAVRVAPRGAGGAVLGAGALGDPPVLGQPEGEPRPEGSDDADDERKNHNAEGDVGEEAEDEASEEENENDDRDQSQRDGHLGRDATAGGAWVVLADTNAVSGLDGRAEGADAALATAVDVDIPAPGVILAFVITKIPEIDGCTGTIQDSVLPVEEE